jgi:hypothetical protein
MIGMLGLGYLKVSGLSLVPVPPHMMHAFIFPKMLFYEYITNDQLPIYERLLVMILESAAFLHHKNQDLSVSLGYSV